MPIRENELDRVVAALEKKWKQKDLVRSATHMPNVRRCPTGSQEFDFMSGGGVPMSRRMTRFYGGESSCKSLMAWNVVKHAQNIHIIAEERYDRLAEFARQDGNKALAAAYIAERDTILKLWPNGCDVVYYNIEQTFDPEFVARAGVDLEKVRVVDDTVIETVGEVMENMIEVGADMHIIDSTTSAIPLDELNMETVEYRRGLAPQRWSLILRRVKQRFQDNNFGIYISQVRVDQRTQGEYASGGKYLDHASDLSVHFRKGSWLHLDKNRVLRLSKETPETVTMSGMKEPDGTEVQCRVEKSRVCRPLLTARMRLGYDGMRIDRMYELKEAAVWYGLVQKAERGGWYELPDGKRVQGEGAIRDAIALDPNLQAMVMDKWNEAIPS